MEPNSVAASIFDVFFDIWCQRVARERFSFEETGLVAGAIGGLASRLLDEHVAAWFQADDPELADGKWSEAIVEAMQSAVVHLSQKLGPNVSNWTWGRLHTLQQKHVLSDRGDLGQLLDRGGIPVRGDYVTVCNTGMAPDYSAPTGAGYRLIADLSDPQGGLWAIDAGSESGHPGSPHYDDQLDDWQSARYHYLPLKREDLAGTADRELILTNRPINGSNREP
jgi:penicillin amidase